MLSFNIHTFDTLFPYPASCLTLIHLLCEQSADGFHPDKSKVNKDKLVAFIQAPVTGDLSEVDTMHPEFSIHYDYFYCIVWIDTRYRSCDHHHPGWELHHHYIRTVREVLELKGGRHGLDRAPWSVLLLVEIHQHPSWLPRGYSALHRREDEHFLRWDLWCRCVRNWLT